MAEETGLISLFAGRGFGFDFGMCLSGTGLGLTASLRLAFVNWLKKFTSKPLMPAVAWPAKTHAHVISIKSP